MKKQIYLLLSLFLLALPAFAENTEHPRVAELEDRLTKDANTFLKGRFPNLPFLVTVKLDAMFRNERTQQAGERLPYFDTETEEIRDEWDDPEVPPLSLMRRVRKAAVLLSVPNAVPESETNEIRETLFTVLHLNRARDEIVIQRRSWAAGEHISWDTIFLILFGLSSLLGGLYLINRSSSQRLAKALAENRSSAPVPAMAPSAPISSGESRSEKSAGIGGNLQVSDPVKLKDIVVRMVDALSNQPGFPSSLDMFELDNFGRRDPGKLGALILEFPLTMQNKMFGLSGDDWWMQALNNPGLLDLETLDVLQRLMRNPRDQASERWSELVISVWRLGEDRTQFLKSLNKEEAFQILSALPKGMALEAARRVFPGNWAAVLDTAENKISMNQKRIVELCETAQRIRPPRDRMDLRHFHERLELLEYLKKVDVYEEKEIYQALPPNSEVPKARPPFYEVLDANADQLRELVPSFRIEEWALLMRDLRTQDRDKLEPLFSEKQRYLLNQKMNLISKRDLESGGILRERVARRWLELKEELKAKQSAQSNQKASAEGPQRVEERRAA